MIRQKTTDERKTLRLKFWIESTTDGSDAPFQPSNDIANSSTQHAQREEHREGNCFTDQLDNVEPDERRMGGLSMFLR